MRNGRAARALRQALSPVCARRSLGVAVVVGTLLNAINQGDVLLAGGDVSYVKLILTYLVPFCVATYGAFTMACVSEAGHLQASDSAAAAD